MKATTRNFGPLFLKLAKKSLANFLNVCNTLSKTDVSKFILNGWALMLVGN